MLPRPLLAPRAAARRAKRRARVLLRPGDRAFERNRRRLADRHLRGAGLEIGALHLPLHVPRATRVRYVDRMDVAALRRHYPELRDLDLVEADVIDDGETLATVEAGSADFVIANHFIEHTQDPIGTLANHLRVLRPGGVLYLAVPDKRLTFDRDREITPLEHVVRDHVDGPDWSRMMHFREWVRHVEGRPLDEVEARAAQLEREDYSIHFHVWTPDAFAELLVHARTQLGLPLELQALERNAHEFVVILQRA